MVPNALLKYYSSLLSSKSLGLIILVISSTAGCVLYFHDDKSFIYFGDAVSHIVRARQFIDSQQPGINNIGTVWLPLPHLLLLPLVAFDSLFYSGIAGAVIGIPFLIGTSILLFSILKTLTDSSLIAFSIALSFGLNPNIIYIALTPMNEISALFFVTLAGYCLLKWYRHNKELWLIYCSIAIVCATLCRYEAWLLPPFISIVALYNGMQLWKGKRNEVLSTIAMAAISWIGLLFWFTWNFFQYGDALKFAHWTYSVGTSAVRVTLQDRPQDVFFVLGKALLWIFGPVMLGAGIVVVLWVKGLWQQKEKYLLLIFFSLPAVFVLGAILTGYVQIDQWWWNWRFVLTFGLFLSTASALALQLLFQKMRLMSIVPIVLFCFVAMPIVQISIPFVGVAVFNDASKSFDERSRSAVALGEYLHKSYEGGSIALLTGYGVGQRIMISSRLPLNTFDVKYFSDGSIPIISDSYIIVGKDRTPESEEFSLYWNTNSKILLHTYNIESENAAFVVLKRKN